MKRKFYILNENIQKDSLYITDSNLTEEHEHSLKENALIKDLKEPIEFYYEGKNIADYISANKSYIAIVSLKFKKVLDPFKINNLHFYPVLLKEKITDKNSKKDYYIMSLPIVSFFDYDKSLYRGLKEEQYIGKIDKMEVDENAMKGFKIVRFKELITQILIDENIKNSLMEADLSGLDLLPSEEFKFPYMP
ncbi:imm11 family protein [Aureibacter tunicatorum]|uniref:Immunity MXAN-0049 protein domain-containing protein n=1 Tax=Aureibacter tunicatorum TaxID=866807 RepID=A0AAE4BUH6_9BACT|nr:DUF1629 domain-containing protein [Aureibacter tunicatorum]MDR6241796.1 hypothetical protein [Aureibacter tunicatorum]BDD07044.1 hypothetical protein AUTU_45270 [Aureibacter tunicatorum]